MALHDDSDHFCLVMLHTLRTNSDMDNVSNYVDVQFLLLVALHSVALHVVVVVVEHLLVHLHVVPFLHLMPSSSISISPAATSSIGATI